MFKNKHNKQVYNKLLFVAYPQLPGQICCIFGHAEVFYLSNHCTFYHLLKGKFQALSDAKIWQQYKGRLDQLVLRTAIGGKKQQP